MHVSTVLFALAPLVGVLAAFLAYRWQRRDHLKERGPWLALLSTSASDVVKTGAPGTLEGVVLEQGEPVVAPFSGRSCLAYTLEIITRETFGNRTTWNRAFTWGRGRVVLAGPTGAPVGEAVLDDAKPIFPPDLMAYSAFSATSDTVFQGAPNAIPQHLAAFLERLAPEVRRLVWDPTIPLVQSKRVFFNERIVVPGKPLVVIGPASHEDTTLVVAGNDDHDVYAGFGTRETERARVAKVPVLEWLFGIAMAGALAGALVAMTGAMLSPKTPPPPKDKGAVAAPSAASADPGSDEDEDIDDAGRH